MQSVYITSVVKINLLVTVDVLGDNNDVIIMDEETIDVVLVKIGFVGVESSVEDMTGRVR